MKKTFIIILAVLSLIGTSVTFAYAYVEYNLTFETEHGVTVGNTIKTVDGLEITLNAYDNNTLTFFELEETNTEKHYLTYVYDYNIIASGLYDIVVSSMNDDIVIDNVEITNVVTITFSLNQTKTYNEGDTLNIGFVFELVEQTLGNYTQDNPLNINNTTDVALYDVLNITAVQAYNIVKNNDYVSLQDVFERNTLSSDFVDSYQSYVDSGIIVFE